ncbi:MAG: lipid-binding SYLF domain-containing protein [Pseudomonadota bacterium]
MTRFDARRRAALLAAAAAAASAALPAWATRAGEDGQVIDLKVDLAMKRLKQNVAGASELLERAKGVLVTPDVTEASFLLGGAYGEGALRLNGATVAFYSLAKGSFGFQAGAQKFDQALFFMTTSALERFRRSEGWELEAEAEVTTPEDGLVAALDTTTSRNPVISVTWGQTGLLAGVSLGGAKFTRIKR